MPRSSSAGHIGTDGPVRMVYAPRQSSSRCGRVLFTSALPVQVLKALEPALASMIKEPPIPAAGPVKVVAEAK